jgi:S1-C subfamily serine protease
MPPATGKERDESGRPKAMRMQDDETGSGADPRAEGEPQDVSSEVSAVPPDTGQPDVVSSGPPEEVLGDGPPEARPRRRGRMAVYAVVVLAAAGLGSAAAIGLTSSTGTPATGVSSHQVPGPQNNVADGHSLRTAAVAARVDPGVVDIDASIAYSGGTSSEGTGMVISRNGLILTNNHVINGSNNIKVRLVTGGKRIQATVVGYDATQDVALLKISGVPNLRPVSVGNSSQVTVGTAVVALGNAEGQGGRPRAAAGIVNSLNKTISPTDESTGDTETLHNMLQTNADIVSGDSGGPLANGAGQVIGMTTANASSSQSSSSVLGYAIPINTALAVAHQIAAGQQGGTVRIGVPGFLGVLVPQSNSSNPQQQAAQQRQQEQQQSQQGSGPGAGDGNGPGGAGTSCANDNSDTSVPATIAPATRGALVDGVLCGTPAVKAGLVSGDVITTVDGQPVTTPGSLTKTMEGFRPGAEVTLGWQTPEGQHQTGRITLAAAPAK